ncbi:MAG TPA: hypothetical protein VM290_05920 [Gaiellaceae bacterium]|jgi:hypothetical protein|nr:hypothetical protein [Gaiellaceae bacterium]
MTVAPVAVVLALALGTFASCGVDEEREARENREVLAQFPPYPGAAEAWSSDQPFDRDEEELVEVWDAVRTTVEYDAPEGTTADDVLRHYREHAPDGWTASHLGFAPILTFCRDGVSVSVDAQATFPEDPTYRVIVVRGDAC